MEDLSGMQLGAYRIIAQVGKGGMAAVYKAYQASMDRYVAVKVLPRDMAADPQFTGRFENEARVVARLQHPHILPVFDYGQAEGYTYFVMPLIETGTLAQALRGKPLPLEEMCTYVMEVGEALQYAHARGLLHRDIKPSNVLIDESGHCLLTDFGIAKLVDRVSNLTATGTLIGTPAYMSPEQGRGQELDRRSDIYSLGIILYELATGRVPYSAQTPVAVIFKHIQDPLPPVEQLNPNLPASLVRVIYKALAKEPEDRYQTAGEMVEALEACLEEARAGRLSAATIVEPPPAVPPTPPPPVISPSIVTPAPSAPPTPAQPAGAPQARRGLGGGALLGLGGLAGLLALGAVALVCGAIFLLPQLFGGQSGTETTRTPAATAAEPTETEQPERTPTRRAPTLTAPTERPDEPTPVSLPTASAGGVLFSDDFETDSGWETRDEDDSLVEYRDGTLAFEIYETRWRVPSLSPAGDLQNVRLEATVRSVGAESDPPIVGAICHHQPDGAYYYLGFSPDGYYGIAYFDGEDGVFLNTEEDSWQATDVIEQFADEYQFEVDCAADGTLRLIVDGVEIAAVVDDTLVSGEIGLFATSFNQVPVEVYFDDLVVSEAGLAGGDVLYQDDFSDTGSGWDTGSSARRAMDYRDGVYVFEVFEPGWRITSEGSAGDLANIHAAVTVASMGASTDPGFGLLCNVQPNGAYYYLGFGPDGYYGIGYYDGESSRLLTNENNDWIISAAIEKYSDPYQLEADCASDGTLRLIVDGVEIASVVDTTLASGNVGLFVSSFEEVPVEVHFDDLIVTALP